MVLSELSMIYAEMWVAGMTCLLLIVDMFLPANKRFLTFALSLVTLLGATLLTLHLMGQGKTLAFFNSFVQDDLSHFLKLVTYLLAAFVFIYSRKYILAHGIVPGEYFALSLFSILGMMILISAYSLLTLYLGVELLALPLYALIALSKNSRSVEAAMKYFVMGALASGMLLYGISLLYGATGSFEIAAVADRLSAGSQAGNATVLIGMILILVGLAFKLGAVPFHMWVPDIYEGSPASVTLFIGSLPEIAGFGMAIRLLWNLLGNLAVAWQPIWIVMTVLSLIVGNVAAIAQTNLKRMLAYSSISHMGFLFLGLAAGAQVGFGPALAYVVIYALMALAGFGLMTLLSHQGFEAENIQDFRGLAKSQPWLAFLMMLVLLSLAGIPPTLGFYGKFLVLNAAVDAGLAWLAVLGVISAVVGAFYYLRVVRVMYFDSPGRDAKEMIAPNIGAVETAVLSLNGLALLGLGLYPAPLIDICMKIFK